MKAWKKFTALVLALGLTAGFAACGGDNSNNGSSSSSETVSGTPEQLDEFAMNALIGELDTITNFTMVGTRVQEENDEIVHASYTASFADGKAYQVTTVTGSVEDAITYGYIGQEDGTYYSWYSTDNQNWFKTAFPAEVTITSVSAEYALATLTPWLNYTYFEYNATTGMHVFSNWGINETQVKVVDGKIVEYKIYDASTGSSGELLESAVITYGNATVGELPSNATEVE